MTLETNQYNLKSIVEKAFVFFTCAMVFSLPFGIFLSKITILVWIFFWIIFVVSNRFKLKIQLSKPQKILFISLLIFLLLHILGLLYTENIKAGLRNINIKIYLFVIPFIVVSSSNFLSQKSKSILNSFVLGNILTSLFLVIRAFYRSLNIIDGKIFFNASVNSDYSFFESISYWGNYFFYSPFSFFGHPSYASLMILISVAIIIFHNNIFQKEKTFLSTFFDNKIIRQTIIFFLIGIVFLLSSKANFLALIVSFFLILVFSGIKRKYLYIFLMILFSIVILSRNGRFSIYLKYLTQEKTTNSSIKSGTQRYYIWQSAFEIIDENFIYGVGTGDVDDEFSNHVGNDKLKSLNNLHNEFIESFVRLGLSGFLTILFIFIFGFWYAYKNRNFTLLLFFTITAINFFFESMLDRVSGTIIFAFFYSFLPFSKQKTTPQKTKSDRITHEILNISLFITLFVYFLTIFQKGLILNAYELNYSNSEFSISFLAFKIWCLIFAIPNLLWVKFFDVFILSLTSVLFFNEFKDFKISKKIVIWFLIIISAVLLSAINLIYINSLLFLLLFFVLKFYVKFYKSNKTKKYLFLSALFFVLFLKILTEVNFTKMNLMEKNNYLFVKNDNLVNSKNIGLIGIKDYEGKILALEEIINFANSDEIIKENCITNIIAFSYLADIEFNAIKKPISKVDSICIFSYKQDNFKGKNIFENENFIVIKTLSTE
ncbi:MAG: O-antigen ligase family protein [Bacteroidales bacterium]|nr:O-antigen ligase family protein [Bacteroidales bacterium]